VVFSSITTIFVNRLLSNNCQVSSMPSTTGLVTLQFSQQIKTSSSSDNLKVGGFRLKVVFNLLKQINNF
jgi:hypothetical protein